MIFLFLYSHRDNDVLNLKFFMSRSSEIVSRCEKGRDHGANAYQAG